MATKSTKPGVEFRSKLKDLDLPTFEISRAPATTQKSSLSKDVIYGVNSLEDLFSEFAKRVQIETTRTKK